MIGLRIVIMEHTLHHRPCDYGEDTQRQNINNQMPGVNRTDRSGFDRSFKLLQDPVGLNACLQKNIVQPFRITMDLLQDKHRYKRIAQKHFHVLRDETIQLIKHRQIRKEDIFDPGYEITDRQTKYCQEQLILAAVVIVEKGFVDAGFIGY